MLVAERKASVLDQIQQVDDEQVLKMIEAILEVHLEAQSIVSSSGEEVADFDPLEYHTNEEISSFEKREDFMGYSVKGEPLFGEEVFEEAEKEIAAIKRGEKKGTSLKEWMQKSKQWQTPTL